MNKELTNGGKPHVCGKIAVHNATLKSGVQLCPRCLMPVDLLKDQ